MAGKNESESGGDKPLDLFLKIGLDERTAKNTVANSKVTANLTAVIHEAAVTDGCDRTVGNLLYTVATKFPANALVHRPTLVKYIVSSKIKTPAQLEAAFSFVAATASDNLSVVGFEAACGVGIEVSLEDIENAVDEIFEENKAIIVEQRYRTNVGELFGYVRKKQPWADPKIVKQIIDKKLYELLGERTAADNEKPTKKKKEKPAKTEAMFVDFGLAKERGGCCYLRYDDTNPEAEKKEYIDHIEEIVGWMGWEPFKFTPHPHAGDKWCIYPSYDYAHCTVDSLENVTHSLNRLVTEKWVDGWDDPRLMTLAGLRRRGVTASSINAFVRGIGITRSDCSMIRLDRLEYHIREELNKTAARTMVVLNPLKVPFSKVVYIEQSDFRMKDSKDYYGLAPGKSVLLRYAFPIKCTEVILGADNETILEIRAEYDPLKKTKPKNPAELDNWLGDLNPQSKVVVTDAYAVPSLRNAAIGDRFQFERLGYFVVDKDSSPGKLVFNRTVTLRDSYSKGGK
ncbi:UNVERIFIED_CONTAM: Glutamine--tRNA ligase [Sesamum indicum]